MYKFLSYFGTSCHPEGCSSWTHMLVALFCACCRLVLHDPHFECVYLQLLLKFHCSLPIQATCLSLSLCVEISRSFSSLVFFCDNEKCQQQPLFHYRLLIASAVRLGFDLVEWQNGISPLLWCHGSVFLRTWVLLDTKNKNKIWASDKSDCWNSTLVFA